MAIDPKDAKSVADSTKETKKSLEQIRELLNDYEKTQATIAERSEKELANLRDKIRFEQEKTKSLTDQKNIIDATVEVERLNAEARIKDLVVQEEFLKTEIAKNDELLRTEALTKEQHKANGEILGQKLEELEKQKEIVEALHEEVELRVESYNALNETEAVTESLVSSITKINNQWKGTLAGRIALASKETGGFSASLKEVGKGLKTALSPANLLGSAYTTIISSTIDLANRQDEAVSSFNRSSGAAGQYNEQLRDLGRENLSLGIDTKDATEAFENLRENFTDFTSLTREQQKEMTRLVATMNEFGVSTKTSSEIMQALTKSMDMSTEQAMIAQREIAATAIALGEAPAKLAEGFAQAAPELAAFGKQGVQVFRELATQAKATGLEVNKLLSIAQNFDTFDSAAESVGKLNAILGGAFLDSMEMIQTTDPAERIVLLRSALDDAGQSFEQMSYYQRRAIADAAGLSDVNDLAKIMSGTLHETAAAAREDALSKEQMADMAQKAQSVQEKLTASMQAFAIAIEPIVDGIRWTLDLFLELKDLMGKAFAPVLLGVLVIYKGLAGAIVKKTAAMVMSIATTTKDTAASIYNAIAKRSQKEATEGVASAQVKQSKATSKAGKTAATSVVPMLALGAAILMIGAGVALVTIGIAQMAESIKGITLGEGALLAGILLAIGAALYFLIPSLVAFAAVAGAAAFPVAALAFALSFIAAGVFLMTLGISKVIDSLSNFAGSAISVLSLASAIKEVANALEEIPSTKALTLALSMERIAESSGKITQASSSGGVKELIVATSQLTAEHVQNVAQLVDQSDRYIQSKQEIGNIIFEPLVKLMQQGASETTASTPAATGAGQRTIILQIGERQIKKVVLDVLNEQTNPRKL